MIVNNPGIVDGNIEPAEPRQRLGRPAVRTAPDLNVTAAAICLPAKFGGQRLKPVRSEIAEHQLCAQPSRNAALPPARSHRWPRSG
jgi:hypothetical protein